MATNDLLVFVLQLYTKAPDKSPEQAALGSIIDKLQQDLEGLKSLQQQWDNAQQWLNSVTPGYPGNPGPVYA